MHAYKLIYANELNENNRNEIKKLQTNEKLFTEKSLVFYLKHYVMELQLEILGILSIRKKKIDVVFSMLEVSLKLQHYNVL